MFAFIWPMALVIVSNAVYQICAKSVPQGMNAFASLTVTYLVGAAASLILYFVLEKDGNLFQEYRKMNWAPAVLGLVIVDSMTMFYRLNYDNMEMRNDFIRQTEILLDIGRNYDVPVIITSQVYTNITTGSIEFLGGHAMNHNAKTIIRLDMRGNGIRNAVIIKHRSLPEGRSAMFRITADGIRDP